MPLGRWWRTVRSLHPLQIVSRPPRILLSRAARSVGSGAAPRLIEHLAPPRDELRRFADSERRRFERRIRHLAEGSALRSFEVEYGLELGGQADGPRPEWRGPSALQAFPASVRSRRIAVAIRCGRAGLEDELARAARAVALQPELHLMGNHLLENGIGLVCAASVANGAEAELWWKLGTALMGWQLEQQFLEDGGHFERSASYHLALTAALLEAILLAESGARPVPPSWREKASGAVAWAMAVRAPDGTYPLFNDAALDSAPALDDVVELARACGVEVRAPRKPLAPSWVEHLASTGWVLAGADDGTFFCIDAGADGASYQPGHVHADALTFELWVRGRRAIVDYGVSSYAVDAARAETRATRSHNTVEIDGRDSSEVWQAFRVGRRCRARVRDISQSTEVVDLEVEHDGYAWLPGHPVHRRRVSLQPGSLRVTDEVLGGEHASVSRLRLASEAKAGIDVRGSHEPATTSGVWYPNFGDPRDAVLFAQQVPTRRAATWQISWRSG